MRDLIDRQQAIDLINARLSQPCKNHTSEFVQGMEDGYCRIRSDIKRLPSAQPTQTNAHPTQFNALDCVSRQAAIDALSDGALINYQAAGHHNGLVKAIDVIKGLPSAQPEPSQVARDVATIIENEKDMRVIATQEKRKTGKWINHRNDDGHNIADCPICGNAIQWFDGEKTPRFCCICGADMRGESDD